jgi:predicted metallo-beta-lactamase superfamily hydrolase
MNIIPLAAESLGVRSAAFFVETGDVKVLIDVAAAGFLGQEDEILEARRQLCF